MRINDREWPEGTEPYEPEVLTVGPTYIGLRLVRDDGADEVHAIPVAASGKATCDECERVIGEGELVYPLWGGGCICMSCLGAPAVEVER